MLRRFWSLLSYFRSGQTPECGILCFWCGAGSGEVENTQAVTRGGARLAFLRYPLRAITTFTQGTPGFVLIPTGSPPGIFSCLQTLLHHSPEQFLYVVLDGLPLSTILIPALWREGVGCLGCPPQPVASGVKVRDVVF